jgi:hypothetical protein
MRCCERRQAVAVAMAAPRARLRLLPVPDGSGISYMLRVVKAPPNKALQLTCRPFGRFGIIFLLPLYCVQAAFISSFHSRITTTRQIIFEQPQLGDQ